MAASGKARSLIGINFTSMMDDDKNEKSLTMNSRGAFCQFSCKLRNTAFSQRNFMSKPHNFLSHSFPHAFACSPLQEGRFDRFPIEKSMFEKFMKLQAKGKKRIRNLHSSTAKNFYHCVALIIFESFFKRKKFMLREFKNYRNQEKDSVEIMPLSQATFFVLMNEQCTSNKACHPLYNIGMTPSALYAETGITRTKYEAQFEFMIIMESFTRITWVQNENHYPGTQ
uniref:Uncharacterized protein n=1 Tax=Romanomermis culicivorax TaxID=13658 RepID=A0A915JX34_ROMCU